jgi:virulence-associated protein VagC
MVRSTVFTIDRSQAVRLISRFFMRVVETVRLRL